MIHELNIKKEISKAKRIGRGYGSNKGGHTVGKGTKGQRSRTGYKAAGRFFEGGQMPLHRRLPILKGLHSRALSKPSRMFIRSRENVILIKSSEINNTFKDGAFVNVDSLIEKGLVKTKAHKFNFIKILHDVDVNVKVVLDGIETSSKVRSSIEKAGGEVK